jgi:hypothetical protein
VEALLDNDFLYKLARYDLMLEFERLLDIRSFDRPYGRISTAAFSLKLMKQPFPSSRWPDERQAKVLREFCLKRSHGVTGSQSDALVRLNVEAFDPGEVTLVAYALEHEQSLVFTGDKRAIRALAIQPELASVAASLTNRIVHLDMVMSALSRRLGWTRVASLVVASGVDPGLQRVYREASELGMSTLLEENIATLRSATGNLLAPSF